MAQGIGWANNHETGFGEYTITSGLEGAWTPTPTQWDNTYLDTIFAHEWELVESPAGAKQWQPREVKEGFLVPDAHVEGKVNPPTMSTADMAMITDPGLPRDRQAVPREPRSARRRVRPGLVQAAPPRHGPGDPLRRSAGARPSSSCGRTTSRPTRDR